MWKRIDIIFKLKSPLHIGYMPFRGSVVSPTRYYVPGKNFWGAVTRKLTEHLFENPDASKYREIGEKVINNFRFSYFYLFDEEIAYLPCYKNNELKFGNGNKLIDKFEFEHRFIGSRILTAIDGRSGTAKDESLHEIEFINNSFKDKNGNFGDTKIIGCVWVRENAKIDEKNIAIKEDGIFIGDFNIIEELILGGESKYGFGHVLFSSINNVRFPMKEKVEDDKIKVEINKEESLPAHFKYEKNIKFMGEIELLTGRGYFDPEKLKNDKNNTKIAGNPGGIISKPQYYFSPGTVLRDNTIGIVNWDGTIEADKSKIN